MLYISEYVTVEEITTVCYYYTVFCRVLRPMADCFIQELLPFAEDLCPTVDVTGQINSMMDVFKFLLPLFEDDQDRVRDMLLNPMQRPVSKLKHLNMFYEGLHIMICI